MHKAQVKVWNEQLTYLLKYYNMKLLQSKDYLLLIDEDVEIKTGDYILEKESIINVFPDYLTDLDECKKIIAYRKLNEEAKELDLPELPNPFEIDVEVIIKDCFGTNDNSKILLNELTHDDLRTLARNGYNHGQVKSKQFSLDDMYRVAIKVANKVSRPKYGEIININEIVDTYIQSLSTQQLPKEFIPEYKKVHKKNSDGEDIGFPVHDSDELKTIKNSEGKEVLVGTYKY